jgi:hypothetical protein
MTASTPTSVKYAPRTHASARATKPTLMRETTDTTMAATRAARVMAAGLMA